MNNAFRRFCNPGNDYCFDAPDNWEVDYHSDYPHMMQVVNPANGASVTASGYNVTSDAVLKDFANVRFLSREEFLKPVDVEQSFEDGSYLELEGIYPGEIEPTYYVIAVTSLGAIFISFSIVTTRDEFVGNRELYINLIQSASICSGA